MTELDVDSIFKDLADTVKSLIIEKIGLRDYFKIQLEKSEGKVREYEGYDAVEQYWRELLGPEFAYGNPKELKTLVHEGDNVILHDVLLTPWVPVVPGSQHVRSLFRENIRDAKIRMGSVRFNIDNKYGIGLFSAHVIQPFVAQNEICKGIPVIINRGAYLTIREIIEAYGAVHVEKISGTLLKIPETYNIGLREKYMTLGIKCVRGMHRSPLALGITGKLGISKPGTPDPILGTAWTIWHPYCKYDWHTFWIGNEDHQFLLEEAVNAIKSRRPKESIPLTDFDQQTTPFIEAQF